MTKKRKNVRAFGHRIEVYYMNIFKETNQFCKTSRNFSKVLDDCKIDIANVPHNIQIKAGEQKGMNPNKIFFEMETLLNINFPPEESVHKKPKVLIHYKLVPKGRKNRLPEDEIVYLPLSDYVSLYKSLKFDIVIREVKKTKVRALRETPYFVCVGIYFQDYLEKIFKRL